MKIFIDTNIFLQIYQLSGPDLEELRKLRRFIEKGKVELLTSQQVIDEFWKNRERVIADSIKTLRDSKVAINIPNIARAHPKATELRDAAKRANALVADIRKDVAEQIEADELKADHVIEELFEKVAVGSVSDEVIRKARTRLDLGRPPGKKGALGDAINWEWLLEQEIEFWDDELVVVSADGDYESELAKGKPREFLIREWGERNPVCELVLETSLTEFLSKRFPGIDLAEEVDKVEEIERLEQSSAFEITHRAVAALLKYDDFKEKEIVRLVNAYLGNSQVLWILGDSDVKELAEKIVKLAATEEAKSAVKPLKNLLDELDDDDDDDIPF
jgi:predicted nucleic acid-binding protein